MTISSRLQQLLDEYHAVPLRDAAEIITPQGQDSAIEARGVKRCLDIALEEERKSKQENLR